MILERLEAGVAGPPYNIVGILRRCISTVKQHSAHSSNNDRKRLKMADRNNDVIYS